MTARLLEGRPVADRIRAHSLERAAAVTRHAGRRPRLAIVLFDPDGAAGVYARSLSRAATAGGVEPQLVTPPAERTAVAAALSALNRDPAVAGIVVAQPLPPGLEPGPVLGMIDPGKDVDGATTVNAGRLARNEAALAPATALGVLALLRAYSVPLAGRRAVVVGRSSVVGRPVAQLLLAANATVTICHSRTADIATETRRAQVLVVAAGHPELVGPGMVAPGAVVVDCGITSVDGTVRGDVAEGVREVAAAVSPVPGGVGPLTAAMLISQTLDVAEHMAGLPVRRIPDGVLGAPAESAAEPGPA